MTTEELFELYTEQGEVSVSDNNAWHCDTHYDTPHVQEYVDEP